MASSALRAGVCLLLLGGVPGLCSAAGRPRRPAAKPTPVAAAPVSPAAPAVPAQASSPTETAPETAETQFRWSTSAYIAAVLEASPEVRQARELLFSADAKLGSEVAQAYLPTLGFSGTLAPAKFATNDTRFTFETWRLHAHDINLSPSVSWNLFNSFQDARSVRLSRLGRDASRQELESALQSRALTALNAYYGLLLAGRLLDVARQNYQAQQQQYELTLDQYKHGMKSLSDLLKTQTDLQTRELSVSESEAQTRLALFKFNVLLGRDEGSPAAIDDRLQLGTTELPSLEAGLRSALTLRPDVIKDRLSLEQADATYQQALQDAFPSISLDAGASHPWSALYESPADRFSSRGMVYTLALRLSLPASFNVYSQVQSARVARSVWRRSRLSSEQLARSIREEVYNAHIGLMRALRSYGISLRKEELSKENLDLVLEQYNQGTRGVIELSQARLDYVEAQTEKMQAFHDANLQRAQYRQAIGEPIWR